MNITLKAVADYKAIQTRMVVEVAGARQEMFFQVARLLFTVAQVLAEYGHSDDASLILAIRERVKPK